MKTKSIIRYCALAMLLSGAVSAAIAQAPGSENIYGGGASVKSIAQGGTVTDVAESVYIGPGTHIINGTWEIYAKNIIIDPAAMVSGSGSIKLYNPSAAGGTANATLLDGNNTASNIDVNIVLQNASGLQLSNIAFPSSLTASDWNNAVSTSSWNLGRNLDLATDGADVFLGTGVAGDLAFGPAATISNYSAQRMVVTNNGTLSHVVKTNSSGVPVSFVFPVGIADGDYTPATVAGDNIYHVSVQDYTPAVPTIPTPDSGMNRTWHIFGGAASSVTLQHNIGTNGIAYIDTSAFITQYLGAGSWSTASVPDYVSPGVHTNTMLVLGSAAGSDNAFLTKKNSLSSTPLPVSLMRFEASASGCDALVSWQAAEEKDLKQYELLHSIDGRSYEVLYRTAPRGQEGVATYEYVHGNAGKGIHFYRLKILHSDNGADYSSAENVNINCAGGASSIAIYPNPAANYVTVNGLDPEKSYTLRLLTIEGRVVLQRFAANAAAIELELSNLSAATYFLQVVDDKQQIQLNTKVIKM